MTWRKLACLLPWRRRMEEREMQLELESLAGMAEPGELGNLTLAAENARQTWRLTSFDGVFADIRYAIRMLTRQPGFVAVAVLSLALGIGASSAIFSFSDALLLRPLPVPRPAEVMSVTASTREAPMEGLSYPDYRDLRAQTRSLSSLVAYASSSLIVATAPAATGQLRLANLVSENFFSALDISPSLGRAFLPNEGKVAGRDAVAILGYDFWMTQYGGDRSVIGRSVRVNGTDFAIVGVAPESFPGMDLLFRPALFLPFSMWGQVERRPKDPMEDRGWHGLAVKGRLAPGVSRESAGAELAAFARNQEREHPDTNRERRLSVRTEIAARIQQAPVRLVLVIMLGTLAGLVLVIGCSNVASLLMARARARGREMAIRVAIGAGRVRLVRQLMTESLVLALLGGAAGLIFADLALDFLGTLELSSDVPIVLGLALDMRLLLFNLAAALVSCMLFGLVPATQAARADLIPPLKSAEWTAAGKPRMTGRNMLVAGQIAMAVVLLVISGVFIERSRNMLRSDGGFRADRLISMGLDPALLRYSPEQTRAFYRNLAARVRALPGVESVALAQTLPYAPNQSYVEVIPEGYGFAPGEERVRVYGGAFDESYFETMKIRLVRGRAFTSADRADSRRVAVVNEAFANTYWPNQEAVGKRLRLERRDGVAIEVVGVAATGHYLYPAEPPTPYVYLPFEQLDRTGMTLVAEANGDPANLAGPLRDAVRTLDPDQPVFDLRTVASHVDRSVRNWMVFVEMIVTLGLIGLVLAMVGLYGLISYSVARRTQEIGLRMALGATREDVVRLVLRQGAMLAGSGVAIGTALAAAAAPALAGGFLGASALSYATYAAIPLGLLAVSLMACALPARRAAGLDPMRALRQD